FSSRRRHTRFSRDWSSDVCSSDLLDEKNQWLINGRVGFYVHAFAVGGIIITLFTIISGHYFEYYYAFNYSDRNLPTHYLISTFWNGQEGSFLLWMFWHAVLGIILIHTNRSEEHTSELQSRENLVCR